MNKHVTNKSQNLHLTPHIEYAKKCASKLMFDGNCNGYVYTVKIADQEHLEYNQHMSNITFYKSDMLEIISIEKLIHPSSII